MLIFHGDRKENKVALTFDDGPNPYGTKKVLNILNKYNVKATFFLIGRWVKAYPDIVKEISRRGHLIGNHSFSHSRWKNDMNKSGHEILKLTKKFPIYIRSPYFSFVPYIPEILSRRFRVVGADVFSYDWKWLYKSKIIKNVTKNTKNGSIVLFHDGSEDPDEKERCKEMIKALPKIIESLKEKYNLVRLDKMKL